MPRRQPLPRPGAARRLVDRCVVERLVDRWMDRWELDRLVDRPLASHAARRPVAGHLGRQTGRRLSQRPRQRPRRQSFESHRHQYRRRLYRPRRSLARKALRSRDPGDISGPGPRPAAGNHSPALTPSVGVSRASRASAKTSIRAEANSLLGLRPRTLGSPPRR